MEIEHKNKNEMNKIFVVPGNGQALLDLPVIDAINIININIHSIGTEHDGGNNNCCTNKATAKSTDMMQETNTAEKCYTLHKHRWHFKI